VLELRSLILFLILILILYLFLLLLWNHQRQVVSK
jgi:hypothetical protein